MMEPAVKDVMTTRVVSMRKDASFREMAAALREHRVSAFPVVDADGEVIGVVSEADMLTKEALGSEPQGMPGMITGLLRHREHAKARGITAGDLCTGSGMFEVSWPSATASATRLARLPRRASMSWPASLLTDPRSDARTTGPHSA